MNYKVLSHSVNPLVSNYFTSSSLTGPEPAPPTGRPAAGQRRFQSQAVEAAIAEFQRHVKDPALGELFANCFPATLDTAVTYGLRASRPDTFVATGSPDTMSLRDSTALVWPYLPLVKQDAPLRQLVAGVINRQTQCILRDPYANAFYYDPARVGEWQPGVHERRWAVDSLCHPIRLGYHYWKTTGDDQPFDADWRQAIALTVRTFREQQRKTGPGPYRFQRPALSATDTQPLGGAGYPVRPVGLVASAFRPSNEATLLPFLVPSNFFAVSALRQTFLMLSDIAHDGPAAQECLALSDEIAVALRQHAIVAHPQLGAVYAYEVDGYGGHALLDEASVPSLLALPYLGAVPLNEPTYQHTRQLALSPANPFFYQGPESIGSPHNSSDLVCPLTVTMRGLTSTADTEIRACVQQLRAAYAGTDYLPESFPENNLAANPGACSAKASALFGEFLWKLYQERPQLLS